VNIEAITFDVGGTLIEPWPSVGHVYAEVAARHGAKNVSPELLNPRFKAAWHSSKDFNYSRAGWQELVRLTFDGLVEPERLTFFPEIYERFAQPDAWRVFEDVLPALDALASRGLRLGIISNWDERLHDLLRQLHLANYFSSTIVSCDIGFTKPSPVIFQQAAAKFGLPPAAVLHVGDSPELDVLGARSAGFHALRIRRNGQEPAGAEDLLALTALPAWIEQFSAGQIR
jgi:putative hydrolase of the HAD superfamily